MTRRRLLKTAGVAALGSLIPRRARAAEWGALPPNLANALAGPDGNGYRVLEIVLYGGLSIWETCWITTNGGAPEWRGFEAEVANLEWVCDGAPSPLETTTFAADANGNEVKWGPATKPIWDLLDNTRLVSQAHNLTPHEAALPYVSTGSRLGSPRLAGMGAAVQHRWLSLAPRVLPYSYVLFPSDAGTFNFLSSPLTATGVHPGASRPLFMRMDGGSLKARLARTHANATTNDLLDYYRNRYATQLSYQGAVTRSKGFASYDASVDSLLGAPELDAVLTNEIMAEATSPICAEHAPKNPPDSVSDDTQVALGLAAHLFRNADARYVCVADGGLTRAFGAPYDTHKNISEAAGHIRTTSHNLFNLLTHLRANVDPTGQDPTKIDLTRTLVVLTTEFSRSPNRIEAGREHHPNGYASVLIGGPIGGGPSIAGSLDTDGLPGAGHGFTATDLRVALLAAAGIYPFEPEGFAVSDPSTLISDGNITGPGTTEGAVEKLLGVAL